MQRVRLLSVVSLLPLLAGCDGSGPAGPDLTALEILAVQGAGQLAGPGSLLPVPLQVRVQNAATGRGVGGVNVRWELLEGVGARLQPVASETDSTGLASTRLTLGQALGAYRVRARVAGMSAPPPEFRADAILAPELTVVPSVSVRAGDTILLTGKNLSPTLELNVVAFSGIRGRVVTATSSELRVEVPACLPSRGVQVRVRIGTLSTSQAPLQVEGGSAFLRLARGEDQVLSGAGGFGCFRLPSEPGAAYLLVPHSTGTVGGASYGISLVGLTRDGVSPVYAAGVGGPAAPLAPRAAGEDTGSGHPSAQEAWELRVRELEKEILARVGPPARAGGGPPPVTAPAAEAVPRAPQVGEDRTFRVLNKKSEFDNVTASLRHVGARSLVYVDLKAPAGGFTDGDLAVLAGEFESPIHPTVTGAFGRESDLDANGKVIILLTASVNQLTGPGSDGYVGGFFFGLDLMRGQAGSNEGEIFYALVPDPGGTVGPALTRNQVLAILPAILAHEFAHMVHFNQRLLVGGASHQDALWLSEAMAQMAEDLVGEAFEEAGRRDKAQQYRLGNWSRARRFLQDPSQVSVLASLPPGTLAERGAGWLLLKQASGQPGREGLLGTLARSTRTGVDNLTTATGRSWGSLVPDWVGSLYLDGLSVPVREGLKMAGVNLRDALSQFDGHYPLSAPVHGAASFAAIGSLWSSAPDYFIITPPATGGIALSASGPGGLPPDAAMGLQFLVVRLQ